MDKTQVAESASTHTVMLICIDLYSSRFERCVAYAFQLLPQQSKNRSSFWHDSQVKGLYRRRCGAWEASRYRGAFAARLGSAPGFRDVYGMRVRWRSLKSAAAVRVW